MESELRRFFGNDVLEKVSIEHLPTGKFTGKRVDGVFIFIGYLPNTGTLQNHVRLNDKKK